MPITEQRAQALAHANMADETTEQTEVPKSTDETASTSADGATGESVPEEAIIGAGEPVMSGSTLALNRKAEGGLSFHFAFDIPAGPKIRSFPKWTHRQLLDGALVAGIVLLAAYLVYDSFFVSQPESVVVAPEVEETAAVITNVRPNVETSFNRTVTEPLLAANVYVDPEALVVGSVVLGADVFVGPGASVRADEGTPIFIGSETNVQDGAVIHALRTFRRGKVIEENIVTVDGQMFAVHIGEEVTIAHGAQIHGPVLIGDKTSVGLNAIVFDAKIGSGVVIEPGAIVMSVVVPDLVVVPAGAVITTQAQADALAAIPKDYPYGDLVQREVEVNKDLAEAYRKAASASEMSGGGEE
jgi:carbonic anhydrase